MLSATSQKVEADVSIKIGVAPECPYGYYDVAPYGCAPSGYYGPDGLMEKFSSAPLRGYTAAWLSSPVQI